jgi:hypothetical protein
MQAEQHETGPAAAGTPPHHHDPHLTSTAPTGVLLTREGW